MYGSLLSKLRPGAKILGKFAEIGALFPAPNGDGEGTGIWAPLPISLVPNDEGFPRIGGGGMLLLTAEIWGGHLNGLGSFG